ncbi:Ldh family oxidoreductase, partial [candidate division KSB1 bacterium]
PLPPGWVVGADGRTKTDADEVLVDLTAGHAALTPLGGIGEELGGHKGYGYATVVELLSAGLQMGDFLKQLNGVQNGHKVPILLGHFFIAIDIAHFHEVDEVKRQMGDILRALRNSQKAADAERIYTHGEKEYLHSLERAQNGVPLPLKVCQQMSQMRDELRLDYTFEWD